MCAGEYSQGIQMNPLLEDKLLVLANEAKESVPKMILDPEEWIKQYNIIYGRLIIRECINQAKEARSLEAATRITMYFGVR